jgi:catechol 2,3-dioxygenase-like lactoylglutathione lyase family enzyme
MSNNKEQFIPIFQGIDTVTVRVANISRSKYWYQSKLGLKIVCEEPLKSLVVLDTGNATSIKLWQAEDSILPRKITTSYIIFNTPDVKYMHAYLKSLQIRTEVIIESDYVKYFFFYDLDGNVLEVCQVL